MDWSQPVVIPAGAAGKAAGLRRLIFVLLWPASHIIYAALLFLLMAGWLVRFIVRHRTAGRRNIRQVSDHHTIREPV